MSKSKATAKRTESQKLIEDFKTRIGILVSRGPGDIEERVKDIHLMNTSLDQILISVSGDAYRQGVVDGKRNRDKKIEVIDHSDWS